MNSIAIIAALHTELAAVHKQITEKKEIKVSNFIFHEGKLYGKDVVLATCGVGKVSVAMTTQKIIDEFHPTAVIMTGTCGALKDDLQIGDIVVSRDVMQHDMDVTALGFKRGEIPFAQSSIFIADERLLKLALEVQSENNKIIPGRILSGDQFYTKEQTLARTYLFDELKGDVQDMESAATAQICTFNHVPFLILRIVDSELQGNQEEQYQEIADKVVGNSLPIIEHILKCYLITIHKAKAEEVLEIKRLLYETWTTTYSNVYSPEAIAMVTSEWHAPEFLKQQVEDKNAIFLVAKEGANIIGMCNAALTHEGITINMQRLHVAPQYQGQGIGTKLVEEVIKSFPNAKKVELEVEKQNVKAQSFYKKHGFKISGEKTFAVKNIPIDCFVMEKIL